MSAPKPGIVILAVLVAAVVGMSVFYVDERELAVKFRFGSARSSRLISNQASISSFRSSTTCASFRGAS